MQADTSDSSVDSPHTHAASTGAVSANSSEAPASLMAHHTAGPASEHIARQSAVASDTQDMVQDKSAEQAPLNFAVKTSEEAAVGQASFMSDGSFVNVSASQEDDSAADLTEALEPADADAGINKDMPENVEDIQAANLELSAETEEVLGLLDSATQQMQASVYMDEEEAADTGADVNACDDQVRPGRLPGRLSES